jgi:hypothetical protein
MIRFFLSLLFLSGSVALAQPPFQVYTVSVNEHGKADVVSKFLPKFHLTLAVKGEKLTSAVVSPDRDAKYVLGTTDEGVYVWAVALKGKLVYEKKGKNATASFDPVDLECRTVAGTFGKEAFSVRFEDPDPPIHHARANKAGDKVELYKIPGGGGKPIASFDAPKGYTFKDGDATQDGRFIVGYGPAGLCGWNTTSGKLVLEVKGKVTLAVFLKEANLFVEIDGIDFKMYNLGDKSMN